ncbi:MAG TPA: 1-deoxy-D-xylulose-5-phosphate synthase, partial [Clostridiales bacterium]|nr:1-deoxy-D-xylulose-5-phosphate synthase [Clostridiales bacterium]
LNDNEMSISKNVGGLSKYLSRLRTTKSYIKADKHVKIWTEKIPLIGKPIVRLIQRLKSTVKYAMMPGVFFEDIGFKYIGPIDGHNIRKMISTFQSVSEIQAPVIIHVATQKGRGYPFAEKCPDDYHSVAPFCISTGEKNGSSKNMKYSDIFADEVVRQAEKNPLIVTISAAMAKGTGLDRFEKKFPNRFFDVGIAEQHAVTFAAGLAAGGLIPVVAIYSTFLQRAYDQLLHDVALQNLHVIFAIDRAGLAEGDGETHHGIYDVSFLMHIPNITILAAADYNDLEHMLRYAITQAKGPVAIRYP